VEHAYHCNELPDFEIQVMDVLFNILRWTKVFVKKEVLVNFLTDPQ